MRRLWILVLLLPLAAQDDPEELSGQLVQVKRLYIDKFAGGEGAAQLRDMIIAALQKTRMFVLTENPDRADAILRGSGEDLIFTDTFSSSEGIQARGGFSAGKGASSSKDREHLSVSSGFGESENSRIAERKHEASASVRIVNRDGDVIWSTMQESQGAKFRSASADVADRIAKQLQNDLGKLKGVPAAGSPLPAAKPFPSSPVQPATQP